MSSDDPTQRITRQNQAKESFIITAAVVALRNHMNQPITRPIRIVADPVTGGFCFLFLVAQDLPSRLQHLIINFASQVPSLELRRLVKLLYSFNLCTVIKLFWYGYNIFVFFFEFSCVSSTRHACKLYKPHGVAMSDLFTHADDSRGSKAFIHVCLSLSAV